MRLLGRSHELHLFMHIVPYFPRAPGEELGINFLDI